MKSIELVFFAGCPNVDAARDQLRRAVEVAGLPSIWQEHDVASPGAPARVRGYGSPTILVDARDVAGGAGEDGPACRVYPGSEVRGVPPLDAIVSALRAAPPSDAGSGRAASAAVIPGAILAVLPVVSCPSCWPAYAAVLSALGVPFLMEESWLTPLTVGALALALGGLGFRARRRRGHGPLALGGAAAVAILGAKFWLESSALVYLGTALLVAASAWNGWPKRKTLGPACCDCAPGGAPPHSASA